MGLGREVLVLWVVSPLQTELCLVGSSQCPRRAGFGRALIPEAALVGRQVWGEGAVGAFAEL